MKPKEYPVLEHAVEIGVAVGYRRAHKHNAHPTPEQVQATIEEAVINSICEWFDIAPNYDDSDDIVKGL